MQIIVEKLTNQGKKDEQREKFILDINKWYIIGLIIVSIAVIIH